MIEVKRKELDLFPVPFAVINLGEASRPMNKRMLEIIFEDKTRFPVSPQRTAVGSWQSTNPLELKYPEFNEYSKLFHELVSPTVERAGVRGDLNKLINVQDMWANVNESASAFHLPHIHGFGKTIFSAVYYPSSGIHNGIHLSDKQDLDQDPQLYSSSHPEPGDIAFVDPALNIKRQVFSYDFVRYPYYGLEVCLKPREGILVVFPHYLTHFVTPTAKDNFIRTSITFNIDLVDHLKERFHGTN
jgi:hypothetical protein